MISFLAAETYASRLTPSRRYERMRRVYVGCTTKIISSVKECEGRDSTFTHLYIFHPLVLML